MTRKTKAAPKRHKLCIDKLDELSLVDRPAQAPALVTLLKRVDDEPIITSVSRAQESTIMTTDAETIAKLREELAAANAIIAMTAEERAFHGKLTGGEADAFIAKSATARKAQMDADQVVYTALDGTQIRKSQDPTGLIVKYAKQADEAERAAKDAESRAADVALEKRAAELLPHVTGEISVRKALVSAVECISDDNVRKAALAILKTADEALSKAFSDVGTGAAEQPKTSTDPREKLNALVEKRMADKGESKSVATMKLLDGAERSAEAVALYEQIYAPASAAQ